MKVLVFGGRNYANKSKVWSALDRVLKKYPQMIVISGMASGADAIAAQWAREHPAELMEFHANWKAHGRAAGPIRNQRMMDEGRPDAAIGFPGGTGTADMASRLAAAGVSIWWPDGTG